MSDNDLVKANNYILTINKSMEKISANIKELLSTDIKETDDVSEIKFRYETILSKKQLYTSNLEKELSAREIEKFKSFNKSTLRINIKTFKGYNCNTDIYTFKSEFNKV